MNQRTILRTVLIAVLSLVATTATAYDFEVGGIYYNKVGTKVTVTSGDNKYSGDIVIPSSVTYQEITYSVDEIDYHAFEECSGLTNVSIPNSVFRINDYAFYGCTGLTSVNIPNSVELIMRFAFEECSGLKSVTIGNSVRHIGSMAFNECINLESIIVNSGNTTYDSRDNCNAIIKTESNSLIFGCKNTIIPNTVTSIGGYAFEGCSGLTNITIPNSVTSIGESAFSYCSSLTSVTIPNSVTSIGSEAFRDCSGLTTVSIGNSVTSIGLRAFSYCIGLTSITIPNSVTSIGGDAFYDCSGLTSVTIGNSVKTIGSAAFKGCSGLTSVTIPNSVISIGYMAFYDCSGLTSIIVDSKNQIYDSRENCNAIIETASNKLLYGSNNTIIPNSVTSIFNFAFWGCSGLTSVSIPNSVTYIGYSAFVGCSGLESIVVESGNSKYDSRDNCNAIIETASNKLLYGSNNTIIPNSVTSIGEAAFSGCSGLTSVTIPNSVTSIGEEAFYECSGLTSVTIPNSVTAIGNSAFSGCSGLTSVTIPNSVNSIGYYAFYNCSGLKTIFYNAENCADVNASSRVFYLWSSNLNIIIGNDVKKVPNYLFYSLDYAPKRVISQSDTPPTCGANTFNSNAYTAKLYVPSEAIVDYKAADVWKKFTTIGGIGTNDAVNVADLIEGTNRVNFGLQGVKMHDGVLYACTTVESVNKSNPTLHGNNAVNMDTYEDRNFDEFDQRDWVAISGLVGDFEGKELSYPFVATFANGVLTPSETITKVDASAYTLNTFRAENILHGGYSNYAEGDYKAYYVPARVNEVANFMGHIETVGEVKYLYSNNANGRKDGEGIKIEGNIANNSESYSLMEGILVADATTKAGVKIIMLKDLGAATGVEGVDVAAARIYTANGCIIIAATEDGEATVYDFTGRLIKSVPVASGNSTAVPVTPGYYIVRTGVKTQSVVVK